MEGAYTKEIYGNPNASSIYACFYICTFKEVVIRKCTFIHLYASSIYAHIQKRAYTEDAIMEVANFRINAHIQKIECAYMEDSFRICAFWLP
jgi:hypothetical protein